MDRGSVSAVADSLSGDEQTIMRSIARIAKTKTNVFSEGQVRKKKECKSMDVDAILKSLQDVGLVQSVKRRVWQTTPMGRQVAHYLEKKWAEQYGLRFLRQ